MDRLGELIAAGLPHAAQINQIQGGLSSIQTGRRDMEVTDSRQQAGMAEQTLHQSQLDAALDELGGKGVTQQMNPAFAPHATPTHGPVIDVLTGAPVHRLVGGSAQKEPGTVLAGTSLALCPPVLF